MFAFSGKKDTSLVGVDIGSSSVKLVALKNQSGQFSLQGYAIIPIPPGAVIDGNVQDVAQVSDAVERAARVASGDLGGVVVAVPSSAVITKRIEISGAFSELELEDQVKVEADQFIPYPLDEVAIDFEVVGPCAHNADLNEILVVACRRDDVELREDAINSSGLRCVVVDVDTYAVERAYTMLDQESREEGELVGVVDVGAATLTLNVFRDGAIVYSREQAFGGSELTNSVHQYTGMPIAEVDQKLRMDELPSDVKQMFVEPFRSTVAQQVSRALQFFYSSGVHSELRCLYLVGGSAAIEGLEQQVQQEIGVSTFMGNPFERMTVNAKINRHRLAAEAPALVKACGLAMRPVRS